MRTNGNIDGCENDWLTTCPSSLYPSTYSDLPEDQRDWGCGHWTNYFDRNISKMGLPLARELIRTDIDRQPSWSDFRYCQYDCAFLQYLYDKGIDVSNLVSDLSCTLKTVTETVKTTAETTSTLAKFAIPILLIGGVVVAYNYKDIKKLL